ncbi:hypothetical protein [Paenibacillus paeoniae]|uniref:Uncharacterized protein n=1 Tax=Paenibacillus paeoniae TaxID=2292705 RepID=A0A371PIA1_9BACL|nr:hypothetical protein [Paenibacillus paeoniae]REK75952.1 hypothetical protein DX130_02430 [Paenibacillus paeoniae]
MMKKKVIAAFLLIAAVVGVISANVIATDKLTHDVDRIKKNISEIDHLDREVLAKVGEKEISNIDVAKYITFNNHFDQAVKLSEETVLGTLISEELFYQEAVNSGFGVSLEDAIEEANKNRTFLERESENTLKTHAKLLEIMNIGNEQYWNELVPLEYQKTIALQKYTDYLIMEGKINFDGTDIGSVGQQLQQYKNNLFAKYLENS